MADSKITGLTELTALAAGDKHAIVDVSDPTESAGGTTKYYKHSSITAAGSDLITGTDDAKFATAKALADAGISPRRVCEIKIADDTSPLTTGDGKYIFTIPLEMNGMNLVAAHASVSTVSSSGTPTYQIRNVTDSVDMLSTKITIDATEFTSYTATSSVIDTAHDDVATGDLIAIDKDVAGTGEKGDTIILSFRLP